MTESELRSLLREVVAGGRRSMLPYCKCGRLATRKKMKVPRPTRGEVVAWFFCDDHSRPGVLEYEPTATADLARRVRQALESP